MKRESTSPPSEHTESRRGFVGAIVAVGVSVAGVLLAPLALVRSKNGKGGAVAGGDSKAGEKRRARWGMSIDLDRCAGCGACTVACKAENNISDGTVEEKWQGRRIEWMTLKQDVVGSYPSTRVRVMPMPCNHCADPPCVKVCPVGATYINDEGIVAVVWDQCIGCRYCMVACPYSRRHFNWFEPHWPDEAQLMLNPDVATRPRGVVEKCTFCHHRIRRARLEARQQDRPLKDGDARTACQQACPAKAIEFGDLNDRKSRVSVAARSVRASRLLEQSGTEPQVFYLSTGGDP